MSVEPFEENIFDLKSKPETERIPEFITTEEQIWKEIKNRIRSKYFYSIKDRYKRNIRPRNSFMTMTILKSKVKKR